MWRSVRQNRFSECQKMRDECLYLKHSDFAMKKTVWFLFALSALTFGLYPVIYFVIDRNFGLLSTKSADLLANYYWGLGFYTHILGGGIALLIGWTQFSPRLRSRSPALHRNLGKIYLFAVLCSGLAGLAIAFYATGGLVASVGFISLAGIWLYTSYRAYQHIRHGRIPAHQRMMTYSYAACFAAVTLRLWLPILILIFQDFMLAYQIVAWLCWVPNLWVAVAVGRGQ